MEIAYVNIFVSDLARAISFYENTIGLPLEQADADFGYASFTAGKVRLGIAVAAADQSQLIGRHTGIGLAVSDLESEYARLRDAGVSFETPPTHQPWGGFMAMLRDPDGNVFYLDQVSSAHS